MTTTFDSKCYELAKAFIDEEAEHKVDANDRPMTDEHKEAYYAELASEIQTTIEDFLEFRFGGPPLE